MSVSLFPLADFYKHLIEQQMKLLVTMVAEKIPDKIETNNTDVPTCPWCGRDYGNYADFEFGDQQILCCKENSSRRFNVIRHKSGNVTYSTHKIKPSVFKK